MHLQSKVNGFFKRLSCVAIAALVSMPAVAAVACDDDGALVNPTLALCSTHVYNIGGDKNLSDGADREMMREVVAMKTTLMTQQMNKQYEYLESMIRRFKTQLEKAVLATRLEKSGAGGADSSGGGSSSSFKSEDKYIVLSGTQNCMKMSSVDASLTCLQSNVRIAMDAIAAGNTREAKKQLEQDLKAWKNIKGKEGADVEGCSDVAKKTKKEEVQTCATNFNYALMMYVDNRTWERTQKKDK